MERGGAVALPWIAASAALELGYFLLLTTAYSRSDVGLVYPIAHGTAPVPYVILVLAPVAGAVVLLEVGSGRASALRAVDLRTASVAAIASFSAYALVLAALELAPAASVAAVRESSILFAAVLGACVKQGARGTVLSCGHHISPAWRNGRAAPICFEGVIREPT